MGDKSSYNKKYYRAHRGKAAAKRRVARLRAAGTLEKYKLTPEERRAMNKRLKENKPLTLIDKRIIKKSVDLGSLTAGVRAVRPEIKQPGVVASRMLQRPAVKSALVQAQQAAGITDDYLTRKLKEGLDAHETKFFAHEGEVISRERVIDFGTRHRYLETAHKLRGDMADGGKDTGAVIINITEITGTRQAETVEEAAK